MATIYTDMIEAVNTFNSLRKRIENMESLLSSMETVRFELTAERDYTRESVRIQPGAAVAFLQSALSNMKKEAEALEAKLKACALIIQGA